MQNRVCHLFGIRYPIIRKHSVNHVANFVN